MFRVLLRRFDIKAISVLAVVLATSFFTPAYSAPVPNDDEQEILVKTTLMTFNDANLTGNYNILYDKAAKQFRAQIPLQKVTDSFKEFRDKKINLESIVGDELDSSKKASIDGDGVLNLKGRFKNDEKKIRYDLNFVYQDGTWKLLGLVVDYKQE